MTTQKLLTLAVLGSLFASSLAMASNNKEYTFKELALKDFRQMEALVYSKSGPNLINDDEREPKVREALKLVLSRRNIDGKRGQLVTSLQGQLPEAFFLLSLQKITEEAIQNMKSESLPLVNKTTANIILENIVAELKPRGSDYRSIINLIKEAKIELSNELRTYRKLESMNADISPSELAKIALKEDVAAAPIVASSNVEMKAPSKDYLPDLIE